MGKKQQKSNHKSKSKPKSSAKESNVFPSDSFSFPEAFSAVFRVGDVVKIHSLTTVKYNDLPGMILEPLNENGRYKVQVELMTGPVQRKSLLIKPENLKIIGDTDCSDIPDRQVVEWIVDANDERLKRIYGDKYKEHIAQMPPLGPYTRREGKDELGRLIYMAMEALNKGKASKALDVSKKAVQIAFMLFQTSALAHSLGLVALALTILNQLEDAENYALAALETCGATFNLVQWKIQFSFGTPNMYAPGLSNPSCCYPPKLIAMCLSKAYLTLGETYTAAKKPSKVRVNVFLFENVQG